MYFGFSRLERPVRSVGWPNHADKQYEMVGEAELPDFPTPVVVTDLRGRSRWTISIPADHVFPLKPEQYAEMCMQTMEVSEHVADLHAHKHKTHAAHYGYYHVDPNFMDVHEAVELGLLPSGKGKASTDKAQGSIVGLSGNGASYGEVCEKSMTFVLETHDAGLGNTLMMLWTAYGLAQKEGRAFFIDDSRWYVPGPLYLFLLLSQILLHLISCL